MPEKPKLMMIRVFDTTLRIIGYVDAKVARIAGHEVEPDKLFPIKLYSSPNELAEAIAAEAIAAGNPDAEEQSCSLPTIWAKVETHAFYLPGKYATGPDAMPPDAVIYNLILVDYPDNLWDYPGWYKRH